MSKRQKISLIALFITSCVIFSFSLQVSEVSSKQSGFIVNILLPFLTSIFGNTLSMDTLTYLVRKTAHFSEYAFLGLLGGNAMETWKENKYASLFLLYGPFNALCDETIQAFVPGRSCEIKDMLLDSMGYFFGLLFFFLVLKLVKQYFENKPKSN